MNYGQRLLEVIEKKGYTRNSVSKILSVTQYNVAYWCNQEFPPLDAIIKVCNVIGVTLEEFFEPGYRYNISQECLDMAKIIDRLSDDTKAKVLKVVSASLDLLL